MPSITEEDLGGLRGPRARAATAFWKENWWRMLSRPGHGRFVVQHHWRGLLDTEARRDEVWLLRNTNHSVHEDVRHEASRSWSGVPSPTRLWGYAIFTNVRDIAHTSRHRRSVLAALRSSATPQVAYGIAFKLPQPDSWLRIGRPPVAFPPREPGSTTQKWSKFFALDWGTYHVGVCREHAMEIFYRSAHPDGVRGRYLLSFIETSEGRRWTVRRPADQTPIAQRTSPERLIRELRRKGQRYLIWSDGTAPPRLIDVRTGRVVKVQTVAKAYPVRILKQDMKLGLVYGEVLVPDERDADGEVVTAEEIRRAAHDYMVRSRKLDYRHQRLVEPSEAVLVESWIAPVTFRWAGRTIREGTWIIGIWVRDPFLRQEIASGELNAFSIRGTAERIMGGERVG